LATPPDQEEFKRVRKGYDPAMVHERLEELDAQIVGVTERNGALERQLVDAGEELAQVLRQLDSERDRAANLEDQLNEAHQLGEAVRLMLLEASKTRDRMIAESEATLEEAQADARRESGRIVDQALDRAGAIVAQARQERTDLVEEGRAALAALERDASHRIADLEAEYAELSNRFEAMQQMYRQIDHTLGSFFDDAGELFETGVPPTEITRIA
jgi:DNA repair exonuclease SbcCD ATPase subunit